MCKNFGCSYLLIVACGIALTLSYVQCDNRPPNGYTESAEVFASGREKRSIIKTGFSLWKGIKATMSLLKGARKMFRSKAYTQYVKLGGRSQAEADFYSVRPSNILDNGLFKSGMVGDRRITLMLGPEPAVSIYIPKRLPSKTVEQIVDTIFYVM